ncbi:MAG: M14 family zinc carboxypeptidase, partial [Phycisphaerales bacterium]
MQIRRALAAPAFVLAALAGGCASGPASAQPATSIPSLPWPSSGGDPVPENHYTYFGGFDLSDNVPTPKETIGHDVGERFTRHAEILRYLTTLAAESDRVTIDQYGWTHERRPLTLVTISSPENLRNLDDILARNLELTDPRKTDATRAREIAERNPAVAWFSFNVHGNEASCSEVAVQLAYTLAAAEIDEVRDILDNVVLVIDPMLNPDGRERYVSFFDGAFGTSPDPAEYTAEHDEPWPGARTNHYYFDLNRDWLWMVHPESRSRIAAYAKRKPQLHIDYHEQEPESPYFFGPGDAPYNANIPAETREWLDIYGQANARVFDERGLEYSTRERFDYLYPGYGKVLPVYHGAVGLLCEKAGHGIAGVSINVRDRYDLLLRDRVRDHFLTAMSYLETTAARRQDQLERFYRFHEDAMELAPGEPVAYAISAATDPALKQKVWDLLTPHGVEIETLVEDTAVGGLIEYRDGATVDDGTLGAGSWIVRVDQPMGRLVRTIFERITHVEHPDTYDITAWSMPVAFGLDAYAVTHAEVLDTTPLDQWSMPR